jgi:hypothetical protein
VKRSGIAWRIWGLFALLGTAPALGVAGGTVIGVEAEGHRIPGAVVSLYRGEELVTQKETDTGGSVMIPSEAGSYTVAVDTGGEPPTRVPVKVEGGRVASYLLSPGATTADRRERPPPAYQAPADAETEPGYAFEVAHRDGVVTTRIGTPSGLIFVTGPALARAGDPTTWSYKVYPSGDKPKQVQKNSRLLAQCVLRIADRTVPLSGPERWVMQPAEVIRVTLLDARERAVAGGSLRLWLQGSAQAGPRAVPTAAPTPAGPPAVPTAAPTPPSESLLLPVDEPLLVQAGAAFGLRGSFDGDGTNTVLEIDGQTVPVAGESTLEVAFYVPADAVGRVTISVRDGGYTETVAARSLRLDLSADDLDLDKGQVTNLHAVISGLEDLEGPAYFALINWSPKVSLSGGNAQFLTINPGDPDPKGRLKVERTLKGIERGRFVITGVVVRP